MNDTKLMFGYRVPDGVTAAWGARLIVTQGGGVDLLWDRQDAVGPDDERRALLDYLDSTVKMGWQDTLAELLRSGEVRTNERKEVVLYEDDVVRIEGNANASHGYFYVVAYVIPREEP